MPNSKFAREDFLAVTEVAPEGYFDPVSRVFLRTAASKDELSELMELTGAPQNECRDLQK